MLSQHATYHIGVNTFIKYIQSKLLHELRTVGCLYLKCCEYTGVFFEYFFFCITHHWIICKAKFFNLGVKFSIFWQCTHVVSMYHEDLWDAQLIFSLTEKVRRILFLYGVMRYFVPSKWNFNEISREIIILQEFKCDVRKSVIRFFFIPCKDFRKKPGSSQVHQRLSIIKIPL